MTSIRGRVLARFWQFPSIFSIFFLVFFLVFSTEHLANRCWNTRDFFLPYLRSNARNMRYQGNGKMLFLFFF